MGVLAVPPKGEQGFTVCTSGSCLWLAAGPQADLVGVPGVPHSRLNRLLELRSGVTLLDGGRCGVDQHQRCIGWVVDLDQVGSHEQDAACGRRRTRPHLRTRTAVHDAGTQVGALRKSERVIEQPDATLRLATDIRIVACFMQPAGTLLGVGAEAGWPLEWSRGCRETASPARP